MKQRRSKILIPSLIIALLVVSAGLVASFLYISRDTNPIPETIRSKLTFSPFVIPNDSTIYETTEYELGSTETGAQLLSYVTTIEGVRVTISQYPQPPEFSDIPEYKDRFLSSVIRQYASIQTSNGTVYLGRQSLQNNKQVGVILERGLLVFVSPPQDLSQDAWRKFGDELKIQKTN